MPFKRIGRKVLKKATTVVGGLIGIGSGGSLAIGESLTGEVILDGVLLLGAIIIIAINGKEGVPDWMIDMMKSRREKAE